MVPLAVSCLRGGDMVTLTASYLRGGDWVPLAVSFLRGVVESYCEVAMESS